MVEAAAHLVDKVFPKKPLRQWVLSFPFHLRLLFAKNPKVMGEVLNIVNRSISSTLIKKTNLTQKSGAKTGSVTFIQRFGGSLNLNIHFHMMYLEGAYTFVDGIPHFHRISLLRPCEMDCLLKKIVHRVIKHLEKRGLIERGEMGEEYLSMENPNGMDQVHGFSTTYRVAIGKYKGRKAITLRTLTPTDRVSKTNFLARYAGFSLHNGVACQTHERKKLERICRYISRPSLSEERLFLNGRGQVVYKLKTPYNNGTTHIVLDPLDFLSRLASLVPKPKINLTRFHGVFAPNFKYRSLVVPENPSQKESGDEVENSELNRNKKKSYSMTWAQRLKRVFGIDIEVCLKCGGKVKVIACIEDPKVIEKILTHLGFDVKSPVPWSPRGPPQDQYGT